MKLDFEVSREKKSIDVYLSKNLKYGTPEPRKSPLLDNP